MSKEKNKQRQRPQKPSASPPADTGMAAVTQETLVNAMVDAHFKIREEEERRRKEAKAAWQKEIGLQVENNRSEGRWQAIKANIREGKVLLKVLMKPRKYMHEGLGITLFMSVFLQFILLLIEGFLCGLAVLMVLAGVLGILQDGVRAALLPGLVALVSAILFLLFSRMVHMAYVDAERTYDQNTIAMLFSSMVAFMAMVFSIMSLSK